MMLDIDLEALYVTLNTPALIHGLQTSNFHNKPILVSTQLIRVKIMFLKSVPT